MCGKLEVGCNIREGFQSMVTNQFDQLAEKIGEMAAEGLTAIGTFWLKIDNKELLATENADGSWNNSVPVEFLQSHMLAVTGAIFTIAILVAGMRIAWEQRAEPLRELLKATMLFVFVCGAGTATLQLLAAWSDAFALRVVEEAVPPDKAFHQVLGKSILQGAAQNAPGQQLPLLVAMFFGVAIFVASVIQVVLLLIRSAMLVLLAGLFPIAAAATNTEIGKAWFKKFCAWSLAFIAYKPAAALVYAAAIKMRAAGITNQSGNGLVGALTGLMMMLLAVFALPALLRFAVPVTAAVAGGSAGMGSSVADPGGVATGAVNVGRSFAGGGAGGGGGFGGGGGGSATGAIGVGAGAGLAVAGAAVGGARKAGGGLAGAAAHSAGEAGGGEITRGGPSGGSNGSGWGSRSRPGGGRSNSTPNDRVPEPVGPTGNG